MSITFYHNPDCSKSRAVQSLLKAQPIPVDVIDYLNTPFTERSVRTLIDALNLPASSLVRCDNDEFRKYGLNAAKLDEQKVIEILMENPALFQRPVVLYQNQARIGRPPEAVLEILA